MGNVTEISECCVGSGHEGADPEEVGLFLTPHAFRAAVRHAIENVEQAGEMDETDVERRSRRARRRPGPIRRGVKT